MPFKVALNRKERLSLSLVAALIAGGEVTRDLIVDAEMPLRNVSPCVYPLFKSLIYTAHQWGADDEDCIGFLAAAIPHLQAASSVADGALQFCPDELDTLRRSFLPYEIAEVIDELKTGIAPTGSDFSESDIVHELPEEATL